ncbi:MAG: 4-demethylwyosine synthase TYW1 [Thermofilum sp.]|jgi:tRNA wybutosine-synthesizing protein 1|uniref:4-demethylwyosine synthase TYW1 n=1 Tax=Thermofilum sp. TaxID=1961369 RepID=UPI00258FA77C|nr:4-demethylwyosine synthase TYW1 [Thermofilum sp.]MCI4408574.1 4-demethylwyosine synthase TYW1 [Thermofilum sp.]
MESTQRIEVARYLRAGYKLVGNHSAVAICRWTRSAIRGERLCYKSWYGIQSHRCLQMTPVLNFCDFACKFCWRMHLPGRFKIPNGWRWDEPEDIINGSIIAQRLLLIGFKGNPKVSKERFLEAMFPRHFTISLDGEPLLYPKLPDLIKRINERNFTTFLVTNGSIPMRLKEMLKKDAHPTNLYLSLYGPNKEVFQATADPKIPNAWENVLTSLELLDQFKKSRTVIRLTMVRDLNMVEPEGYASLIKKANPMFVELKGYTWVGESQKRLPITAMPTLDELEKFAEKIQEITGYKIKVKDDKSRVVMLVRDEEAWETNLKMVEEWKQKVSKLDENWKSKVEDFTMEEHGYKLLYY